MPSFVTFLMEFPSDYLCSIFPDHFQITMGSRAGTECAGSGDRSGGMPDSVGLVVRANRAI